MDSFLSVSLILVCQIKSLLKKENVLSVKNLKSLIKRKRNASLQVVMTDLKNSYRVLNLNNAHPTLEPLKIVNHVKETHALKDRSFLKMEHAKIAKVMNLQIQLEKNVKFPLVT